MKVISSYAVMLVLLLSGTVGAETYKKGSQVKGFSAKDQFGRTYTFKKGTKFLLVSFDMETGKAANQVLTSLGGKHLNSKGVVYVANIHGMPKVGRYFAFKKMKKYSHAIILGDDAELLIPYPQQKGKVTVVELSSSAKVEKISYWTPGVDKLESFLK